MEITLDMPEEVATSLRAKLGDLDKITKELLVARGYKEGVISKQEVAALLGYSSRFEVEETIGQYGDWPGLSLEDVLSDAAVALEAADA